LSGVGAHLRAPTSPSYKPYSADCRQLLDPAFTGKCVIAASPAGTVAGVVEGLDLGKVPAASNGQGSDIQERDLVWHRQGDRWELAEVHTFWNINGLETRLWADDLGRDHDPQLVFVDLTDDPSFGSELDVVAGTGKVALYRFLGQGFADVPPEGGIVTYVPPWVEAKPADDGYYDQTLIGRSGGSWRVFSEQYVPDAAALAQHRGAFWDPDATPAS
jgi:hypothetical protein